MKRLILMLLLVFGSLVLMGQDVVKYDYDQYNGIPIKKGWLFSDEAYKKLYVSYTAADSLIATFEKYDEIIKTYDSLVKSLPQQYEDRLKDKDVVIAKQQTNIVDLKKLIDESDANHKKIMKQFVNIFGVKIHLGTAIKVGLSIGVTGYLIGRF